MTTPGSVSEIKIPESDILQILVDSKGKVFMSLDRAGGSCGSAGESRRGVRSNVHSRRDRQVPSGQFVRSAYQPNEGLFWLLSEDEQDATLKELGIPTDSTDNQFKVWVKSAREQNRDLRIAIKADQTTPYRRLKQS